VTNDSSFLIKIIPPQGYNVYRLHVSRAALVALVAGFVALVIGGLGLHAWQLRAAESDVQALQAQTAAQREQLNDIDREADTLAGQLRDLQRQNAEIRRMLGVGVPATFGAPAKPAAPATHAADLNPTSLAAVRDRLHALGSVSAAAHDDVSRLDRLTHRVLDLRRLAALARERMIASIPQLNPVGGSIASGYGWRANPWPEFHRGLDLEADYGTPVHAAGDAVVAAAGWDSGFGNKVDLDHGNGYHTWYAHLSRFAVAPGQHVHKGDVIAYVGATGEATGPHLHYQVMRGGEAIDPEPFLNGIPRSVLATLSTPARVQ
jgi:murein DD-endopeptidase MepM/ murein hydrolase activator NlpD